MGFAGGSRRRRRAAGSAGGQRVRPAPVAAVASMVGAAVPGGGAARRPLRADGTMARAQTLRTWSHALALSDTGSERAPSIGEGERENVRELDEDADASDPSLGLEQESSTV